MLMNTDLMMFIFRAEERAHRIAFPEPVRFAGTSRHHREAE